MKIISQKEYQSRRNNLLDKMKDNSILLIPGEKEKIRNNDVHYEFRQNSDFWYFSGIEEADATLILLKKGSKKYILFIQEKKVEEEVWTGYRIGAEKAESFYLADEAYSNKDVEKLSNLIFECENIYYNLGSSKDLDKLIHNGLENFNRTKSRTGTPNPMIIDPSVLIDAMRLIKSKNEIDMVQEAINITEKGFIEAIKLSSKFNYEFEIQGIMEKEFRMSGSKRNGYPSIVASGKNSCILHYIENNQKFEEGSLLLIDAGSEWDYYSADVTRTWPVDGKFTSEQKDIYEIVLEANIKAIEECRIGNTITDPHIIALKTLVSGLRDLNILKESEDEIMDKKLYFPFYMHSTSHWLGIDVHDSGKYRDYNENPKKFEEGMILTIEPGLYFGDMAQTITKKYKNIGIRIEDDILITNSGPKNLTNQIPKSIDNLEKLSQ
ncbi:MAG: M24 family metallopeptidase [SAR202 cluster bacterium]|nr:M24 family metallopeptidase [SAR202 cluster bacterium]